MPRVRGLGALPVPEDGELVAQVAPRIRQVGFQGYRTPQRDHGRLRCTGIAQCRAELVVRCRPNSAARR